MKTSQTSHADLSNTVMTPYSSEKHFLIDTSPSSIQMSSQLRRLLYAKESMLKS